jgi:hypothetical protein
MESQTNEQASEQALLELGFGPDPPVSDDASDGRGDESTAQASLEAAIETDPALVPAGASALLVAPAVLDPQEVEALLSGLHSLLEETSAAAAANALAADALTDQQKDGYEPDASTTGCDRRHSQFPSLAWLFPNHAGTGRSTRHQQGHHLRARERPGKKARAAARSPQGSLFGDHR